MRLCCTNTNSSVTSLLDCYMRNMTTDQTVLCDRRFSCLWLTLQSRYTWSAAPTLSSVFSSPYEF